jgi:hypothetical protein
MYREGTARAISFARLTFDAYGKSGISWQGIAFAAGSRLITCPQGRK